MTTLARIAHAWRAYIRKIGWTEQDTAVGLLVLVPLIAVIVIAACMGW